ncbi:hypothetical protein ACHWQZ_G016094 [Mnemiopsis leidyi]
MNSLQVCCGEFIRIILFVLNFIFWAAGGVILGVGIYVKVQVDHLVGVTVSHDTLNTSALFLITLGCIVFVVGLLGCCGSLTQNRCMLLLYFSLVTIIFLGEIALAIAVYANKDTVTQSIKDQFSDCMGKYDNTTTPNNVCKDAIDSVQSVLHCCGVNKTTDWKDYNHPLAPPESCCEDQAKCNYSTAYQDGCFNVINTFVNHNAKYIGFGVLGVALVELLGMSLACYLRTYIMKRDDYEQPYTV